MGCIPPVLQRCPSNSHIYADTREEISGWDWKRKIADILRFKICIFYASPWRLWVSTPPPPFSCVKNFKIFGKSNSLTFQIRLNNWSSLLWTVTYEFCISPLTHFSYQIGVGSGGTEITWFWDDGEWGQQSRREHSCTGSLHRARFTTMDVDCFGFGNIANHGFLLFEFVSCGTVIQNDPSCTFYHIRNHIQGELTLLTTHNLPQKESANSRISSDRLQTTALPWF